MLEDIALMRVLPNMVVLAPCDSVEAEKATLAMATHLQPNYMRLAREATPIRLRRKHLLKLVQLTFLPKD